MARVQLIIPDEDRDRFVYQARREGLTLSAWLMAAARERLEDRATLRTFRVTRGLGRVFQGVRHPERSRDRTGMGRAPERRWAEDPENPARTTHS